MLRLAAMLGRTLHELQQTMTAEEFGIWQEYDALIHKNSTE
jgi:hypothetical protein